MPAKRLSRIQKQIAALEAQAEQISKDAIQEIVSRIQALMAEHGITVTDLRGSKRGRPAKGVKRPKAKKRGRPTKAAAKRPSAKKVKPKYRSPTDRKLTWSGRGRRPKWVQEWIDGGKRLEGLAIR